MLDNFTRTIWIVYLLSEVFLLVLATKNMRVAIAFFCLGLWMVACVQEKVTISDIFEIHLHISLLCKETNGVTKIIKLIYRQWSTTKLCYWAVPAEYFTTVESCLCNNIYARLRFVQIKPFHHRKSVHMT